MNPYIEKIKIKIFDDKFEQEIHFKNGLNLISGENGTGKTNLLTLLKTEGESAPNESGGTTRSSNFSVLAISPKRNSERKSVEDALSYLRQSNKKFSQYISDINTPIQDNTFQAYPPFGELFAHYFEVKDARGGDRIQTMNEVTEEFNVVMKKIFPGYEVIAEWDQAIGNPRIKIQKNGFHLTLNKLSLGEQEMLSLLFNLYISREGYHVYLIDEPEVHLNWSLELNLFRFLEWFCKTYDKQVIASTHARVIFTQEFYPKSQFLLWENGKIVCKPEISEAQKVAIAGEAISLVKIVKLSKKTFFVEDGMHQEFLETLAAIKDKDIAVVACGNKTAVKSLFKFAKTNPEYAEALFMVDGDNEGNPYPGESQFIFLTKYCLECYFFDIHVLASVFSDSAENIKHHIINSMKAKKSDILKYHKFLEFLIDRITPSDIDEAFLTKFDCSEILTEVLGQYSITKKDFIRKYIEKAIELGTLNNIFPQQILDAINSVTSITVANEVIQAEPIVVAGV
jgi:predicted ATPase